jgi:hypothetical protein
VKFLLLALLLVLPLAAADLPSLDAMKSAADNFLGTLDDAKRLKSSFAFADESREHFRFTPQKRTGLALKEMDATQRTAAEKLLKSALSETGQLKAMQIITLEGILADLEKRPEYRDPGKYHISIFGKPGETSGWGWKIEGHHLSLNYTILNNRQISVTPSFFGANPAEVREGAHKNLRVLKAEDDLAHALLQSLLEQGQKDVVFSAKAPAEILTAENRKATAPELVGLPASKMSDGQKKALLELISAYTGRHRDDLAAADMKKIEAAGIDQIRFGWAGGTQRGEAWYYRIQGPTFLMEAANTQNQANHIHTTWRDFQGDFGRDMLSEHYHQHGNDPKEH